MFETGFRANGAVEAPFWKNPSKYFVCEASKNSFLLGASGKNSIAQGTIEEPFLLWQKTLGKSSIAQGTIEYLVILAVVVVISLVVVGLMVGQTGNVASISSNSKQVALKVGGIAILDAVAGEDANALLVLQNNSGDALTLEKVEVDGVDHVFGSEPVIGLGGRVSLDLNGVSPCTGSAKKNYSIKVIYLSSSGLEKTFDFGSVSLDCVPSVTANGAVVSEGGDTNSGENQTPVNGVCGSAEKTYLFDDAFPDGDFCLSGAIDSTPSDPAEGASVTWNCLGVNGGTDSGVCTGTREVQPNPYFIFKVTTTGSPETFSFQSDDAVDLNVNWGDGSESEIFNGTDLRSHEYATAGDYNVLVKGEASRISFGDGTPTLLSDIFAPVSDGVTGITSAQSMFTHTRVTSFTAQDFFDVTSRSVTDMEYMFMDTTFNQDLSGWDTSNVANMHFMFGYSQFDSNISDWNTASVLNMSQMFGYSTIFNQDISGWDTSSVTDMGYMFAEDRSFIQNLSGWNVSSVSNHYNFDSGDVFWGNSAWKPSFP